MGEQVAARINGDVAQLGEHLPCKQGVKGSNPSISTQIIRRAAGSVWTGRRASLLAEAWMDRRKDGYSENIRERGMCAERPDAE